MRDLILFLSLAAAHERLDIWGWRDGERERERERERAGAREGDKYTQSYQMLSVISRFCRRLLY